MHERSGVKNNRGAGQGNLGVVDQLLVPPDVVPALPVCDGLVVICGVVQEEPRKIWHPGHVPHPAVHVILDQPLIPHARWLPHAGVWVHAGVFCVHIANHPHTPPPKLPHACLQCGQGLIPVRQGATKRVDHGHHGPAALSHGQEVFVRARVCRCVVANQRRTEVQRQQHGRVGLGQPLMRVQAVCCLIGCTVHAWGRHVCCGVAVAAACSWPGSKGQAGGYPMEHDGWKAGRHSGGHRTTSKMWLSRTFMDTGRQANLWQEECLAQAWGLVVVSERARMVWLAALHQARRNCKRLKALMS
eukprot:comp22611_c0_seq1/m.34713 comp22611_c0_seq1/g.34713  ORF comp22611_c0_seq1/g.34713 comp22611_c0_seq1/m.34713 type:complete len:301 (+) comp22611_c0_seq1:583-1485(+)